MVEEYSKMDLDRDLLELEESLNSVRKTRFENPKHPEM